ncbi:hypothetical protein MIMGU_mgv1a017193mg [Erythranthe guttata]|uniref:Uncharacterized protein n=1 Tax=Erythranthe guttata TaxID=4155 RepID=A0A022RWT2_ERYGU|nr:hypothetical protein MIMGU_mgv1a017193mg [Erythranthe guttata]
MERLGKKESKLGKAAQLVRVLLNQTEGHSIWVHYVSNHMYRYIYITVEQHFLRFEDDIFVKEKGKFQRQVKYSFLRQNSTSPVCNFTKC